MPVPGQSQVTSGMNVQLFASVAGFVNSLTTAQRKLLTVKTAASVAGAAIAGMAINGVARATAEFREFEQQVARVSKISNRQIGQEVGQGILDMTEKMPVARKELTQLAVDFTRAGVRGSDAIEKMTKLAAKFGIATSVNMEEAADSLIRVQGQLGATEQGMQRIADGIDRVSNTTVSSAKDIFNAMKRSTSALKLIGLGTGEIVALNAALKEVSASSSTAGTALRTLAQQMIRPNKVEDFAKAMGITTEKFREMRDRSPLKLIKQLARTVQSGTEEGAQLLEDFSRAARKVIAKLPRVFDDVDNAVGEFNEQLEEGGELQKEFSVFVSTTNNEMEILRNRLKAAQVEMGRTTTGPLAKLQKAVMRLKIGLTELASAISPLVGGGSGLLGLLGAGLVGLSASFFGLINPITATIGVISTLLTILSSVPAKVDNIGNKLEQNGRAFQRWGEQARNAASSAADAFVEKANDIDDVQNKVDQAQKGVREAFKAFRKQRNQLGSSITGVTPSGTELPDMTEREKSVDRATDQAQELFKNIKEGFLPGREEAKKRARIIMDSFKEFKDEQPIFQFASPEDVKRGNKIAEQYKNIQQLFLRMQPLFQKKFNKVMEDHVGAVANIAKTSKDNVRALKKQIESNQFGKFLQKIPQAAERIEGLSKKRAFQIREVIKSQVVAGVNDATTELRNELLEFTDAPNSIELLKSGNIATKDVRALVKDLEKKMKGALTKASNNVNFAVEDFLVTKEGLEKQSPQLFQKMADGVTVVDEAMQQFNADSQHVIAAMDTLGGKGLESFEPLMEAISETDQRSARLDKLFKQLNEDMSLIGGKIKKGDYGFKELKNTLDATLTKKNRKNLNLSVGALQKILKQTTGAEESFKSSAKQIKKLTSNLVTLEKKGGKAIDSIPNRVGDVIQELIKVRNKSIKNAKQFQKSGAVSENVLDRTQKKIQKVTGQQAKLNNIRKLGSAESVAGMKRNLAVLGVMKDRLNKLDKNFDKALGKGQIKRTEKVDNTLRILHKLIRAIEKETGELEDGLKGAFKNARGPLEKYIDRLQKLGELQGDAFEKNLTRNVQNFVRQLSGAGASIKDINDTMAQVVKRHGENRLNKQPSLKERMVLGPNNLDRFGEIDHKKTAENLQRVRLQFQKINEAADVNAVRKAFGPEMANRIQRDMNMAFKQVAKGTRSAASALAEFRARTSLTFDRFRQQTTDAFWTLLEAGEDSAEELEKVYKNLARAVIKDLVEALVVKSALEPAVNKLAGFASKYIGKGVSALTGGGGAPSGQGQGNITFSQQGGGTKTVNANFEDTPGVLRAEDRALAGFKKGDYFAASQTMEGLRRQVASLGSGAGSSRGTTVVVNQNNTFTSDVKEDVRSQMREFAPELERMTANGIKQRARRGGNDQDVIRGR